MAERRQNRRVLMTKRLMKDALLELLERQELVNISVTAICEAADVHRSTFYKYYKDQADLLRDLEQEYLDRISVPLQDPREWDEEQLLVETTAFFDSVKRNDRAFAVLLGESTSSDFAAKVIDLLRSRYAEGDEAGKNPASYYAQLYVANGTVGMLREWVNRGFPVSSREMAEMMYGFSLAVVQHQKASGRENQ